jgi:hypothetical protein
MSQMKSPGDQMAISSHFSEYRIKYGTLTGQSLKEIGREKVIEKYREVIKSLSTPRKSQVPEPIIEFMQQAELWIDGFVHTK